jgi:5-methylcytosine-specific restriction endonuclease McrA
MAMSQWHLEHREYLRGKTREWHRNNPEKSKAYRKKWYDETREKRNEARRAYYRKNREAVLEKQRLWWKSNPEKATALYRKNVPKAKQWRHANPVMARNTWNRRRERVAATLDKEAINVLSQLISSAGRLQCGICGKNMPKTDRTLDHIIPLSKGGTGDVWNLRIVHRRCNILKAANMPDELNFGGEPVRNWNKQSEECEHRANARVEPKRQNNEIT